MLASRVFGGILMLSGAALALAAATARGEDADWRLEKDRDGIQLYTRAVPGWAIREIRGVTRVPARLSALVAVIHDVPNARELSDLVETAEVTQRDSEARYRVYSTIDMPWPVGDRDIVTQREITQDPATLAVTITDTAQAGVPRVEGLVRIEKSRQQWTLQPLADGAVAVDVHLLSDPAGPIPASLINAMSVSTPLQMLGKLREMAQRPQYAGAQLGFVRDAPGPP